MTDSCVFCGHGFDQHDPEGVCSADGCPCGSDFEWMAKRDADMPSLSRMRLARHVAALRAQGMTHRQVAAELGLSVSYASDLAVDPSGAKTRARKRSYAGTCLSCGKATNGSDGPGRAAEYCAHCGPTARWLVWSREEIVRVIAEVAERIGRVPAAESFQRGDYEGMAKPPEGAVSLGAVTTSAQTRFGGWNKAVAAAGLQPRRTGHRYHRSHEC